MFSAPISVVDLKAKIDVTFRKRKETSNIMCDIGIDKVLER
jgi:hypothetical protein